VRDAFAQFFGPDSDVALAAFVLDPDRAQPLLDKAVTEAEIAGTGARFGVGISETTARRLADVGVNLGTAGQGFSSLAQQSGLFQESISENRDLQAGVEGVAAAFGTDAEAASEVQRRKDARQAAFSGTSQMTTATQKGLTGLGSAGSG
jgi:hypothetical protein